MLEPILAAPEFPEPMYKPLAERAPELLIPGLSRVPPNTVTLLEPNRAFIEAYLVGLNHEMARELLWRGFPTDQRGTYFAQFWDPSCRVPRPLSLADRDARKDIVPIHTWVLPSRLGTHAPSGVGEEVLLVIRGELLRRYPNTIIYAAPLKATAPGQPEDLDESKEVFPIFKANLPPDITFLGFNIAAQDVRDQELFFVLQEQPTEARFGLNATEADRIDPTKPLLDWGDLAWGHFGKDARFVKLGVLPNAASIPTNPIWGVNAAHMAKVTLQTPVRVAIFGPDILPG